MLGNGFSAHQFILSLLVTLVLSTDSSVYYSIEGFFYLVNITDDGRSKMCVAKCRYEESLSFSFASD